MNSNNQTSRLGRSAKDGIKAPVIVSTVSNISLTGLPIISGVQLVAGDRVLVKNQVDSAQNGIYRVYIGNWDRAKDWNRSNDVVNGQLVLDTNSGQLYRASFTGDFAINTTKVGFFVVQSFNSKDDTTLSNSLIDGSLHIGDVVRVSSIDGGTNETTMIFDVIASVTEDIANGIYSGVNHSLAMRDRDIITSSSQASLLARKDIKIGVVASIPSSGLGVDGSQLFDIVLSSSVTTNPVDVLQFTGVSSLAAVERNSRPKSIKVTRSNNNRHYGWGSTARLPSGTWMQVFRSSDNHATTNNSRIMVHYSDDDMSSWYGEKEIFRQTDSDARPDAMYVMANGRIGFIINRATSPALSPYYQPLFFYTDNEGVSWQSVTIPLSSPYTFSAVGGIIDFPASQGGNDTTGFITFGFASAGALDALTTTDNGASWSIVNDIHGFGPVADSMSETCYTRLGTTDRWLIYGRARLAGANTNNSVVFSTTNLLSWGVPVASNVLNKGTPPACVYNEETSKVDLYVVARGGKDLYDYDNALLVASEDAETLWAANGVYTGYPARVAELPNWFTGYLYPFKSGIKTYFTMMFGENPTSTNGSTSAVAVLSDVPTSSKDAATISSIGNKYIKGVRAEYNAESNDPAELQVIFRNNANTAIALYNSYSDRHLLGIPYRSEFDNGYTIDAEGPLIMESIKGHWNAQDIVLGSNPNVGVNGAASVHLNVASSSVPAILSHSDGTASARKHVVFTNPNGIVGSISTSGSATSYTTSSDPRLKTEFEAFSYGGAKGVINELYNCTGLFQFNGDLDKYVLGLNAHKVLDIDGLGSEVGSEGVGSRDLAIGDVYETIKHYKIVDFFYEGEVVYVTCTHEVYTEWLVNNGVVTFDGDKQPDIVPDVDALLLATVTYEEVKVSPAGVDQSKVVPYLIITNKHSMDEIKCLQDESKRKDLVIAEIHKRLTDAGIE